MGKAALVQERERYCRLFKEKSRSEQGMKSDNCVATDSAARKRGGGGCRNNMTDPDRDTSLL